MFVTSFSKHSSYMNSRHWVHFTTLAFIVKHRQYWAYSLKQVKAIYRLKILHALSMVCFINGAQHRGGNIWKGHPILLSTGRWLRADGVDLRGLTTEQTDWPSKWTNRQAIVAKLYWAWWAQKYSLFDFTHAFHFTYASNISGNCWKSLSESVLSTVITFLEFLNKIFGNIKNHMVKLRKQECNKYSNTGS